MTRPGSLARNVFSNWIVLGSNVAYALFITPIIVRALGKDLYGVWSFLNGLLVYSDLLYLGLGAAVVKYVAQFRATGDQTAIDRLVSTVVVIYGLLGLACFGILLALSPVVPRAFAEPLSSEAARMATYTCVLLGAQMFFVFISSAFSGVICGHDRFDLVNAVAIVSIVLRFVGTPLLVRPNHDPLLTLAMLTAVVTVLRAVALVAIAFWRIPRLAIRLRRPHWRELRMLYGFGLQSFFILFAIKLISYTDTTVIGFRLGAASVALYTLPLQLVEYARLCVGGFAGVFLPRLTVLATRGDLAGVREVYFSSMRIASFLTGWLIALLIGLGPAFLNRWVGHEFGTPVQWVLVYLAVAMFGQVLSTQVPVAFYQAIHAVAFPAAVLMFEAVVNLVLSLWLAKWWGITGVAVATIVPAMLVSALILPPYLCRRLQISLRTLLVTSVMPGIVMLAVELTGQWLMALLIPAETYAAILVRALVSVPIAFALFSVTFPGDQRRLIWHQFRFLRQAVSGLL
jgi:O-antigen/teichoic acid export membrane protein